MVVDRSLKLVEPLLSTDQTIANPISDLPDLADEDVVQIQAACPLYPNNPGGRLLGLKARERIIARYAKRLALLLNLVSLLSQSDCPYQ